MTWGKIMREIHVLSKETIDQIAAGEVVERPASVVKELVENAIDAGAGSVTVEIRDGGISLIRITDNGSGIPKDQIRTAFLRHATSKLETLSDLETISSLGFRGEALSSISSVAMVEMITKTPGDLTGIRYRIEGGAEKGFDEIGAPEGTTFLVRNLFYNTPARKKFLKTAATETGYISDLISRLALSHPDIAFQFISGGQTKLHTSGNGNLKDVIYSIYGRQVSSSIIDLPENRAGNGENEIILGGVIGKPAISRGNRNYENYFINGRFVKNPVISKAIEEGYGNHLMQHRYPFTVLFLTIPGTMVDVNVHPAKLEVRFSDGQRIYEQVFAAVRDALSHREMIVSSLPSSWKEEAREKREERSKESRQTASARSPEPFEQLRKNLLAQTESPYQPKYSHVQHRSSSFVPLLVRDGEGAPESVLYTEETQEKISGNMTSGKSDELPGRGGEVSSAAAAGEGSGRSADAESAAAGETSGRPADAEAAAGSTAAGSAAAKMTEENPKSAAGSAAAEKAADHPGTAVLPDHTAAPSQMSLFEEKNGSCGLLLEENRKEHRIIGQLFRTYWLVEYRDHLYIIDQHAAHEKVNYEKLKASFDRHEFTSQQISPPLVVSLSLREMDLLEQYASRFREVGFELEPFGGREYQISAVPDQLLSVADRDLFVQILDSLADTSGKDIDALFCDRLASMACKQSVKGGDELSMEEADALIGALLQLENPYQCPHGRPTIISMSRYDLEKKFKRVL